MEKLTDPEIKKVLKLNEETIIRLTRDIFKDLHATSKESIANRELKDYLKPSDLKVNLIGGESEQEQEQMMRVQAAVIDAVLEVFKRMEYKDDPPESISISSGSLFLPSKEDVPACYGFEEKGEPGRIYVSINGCKKAYGDNSSIPDYVASAAYAAHEAVEHVNNMRGIDLLTSPSKLSSNIHGEAATEQEANKMARKIIREKFGWTVYFGDEKECQKQL